MDIFVNNPPAPVQPYPAQPYPAQAYPVQGYAPAYGYGYGPGFGGVHHGGGFGFVLLTLLGVFVFLRWSRMGGRRRRYAMMAGRGSTDAQPGEGPQTNRDWRPPRFPWARDNAAEIARERFARGEINQDELTTILKGLDAD